MSQDATSVACKGCGIDHTNPEKCPYCETPVSRSRGRPPFPDRGEVRRHRLVQFWISENDEDTMNDKWNESGFKDLSGFIRASIGLDP